MGEDLAFATHSDRIRYSRSWMKVHLEYFLPLRLLEEMAIGYHPSDKYCSCCKENVAQKNVQKYFFGILEIDST